MSTSTLAPGRTLSADPSSDDPVSRTGGGVAPLVIGHRGASGYRPEHTLASYRLAIAMGADYIEPDLVMTRDGVLVARHENEISQTTDVVRRAHFADRRTTKLVDGEPVTGWFTEDFTLAELKSMRAVERLPGVRPANTRYDGRYEIPTFDEILQLLESENQRRVVPIGVYPETKHPTYFRELGLPLEPLLVQSLRAHDLDRPDARVYVQSFEVSNLRELAGELRVPLVQLLDLAGAPYDLVAAGEHTTVLDLVAPTGLTRIAEYATAIGVHKDLVLPRNAKGATAGAGALVDDAHVAGLAVHAWTARDENAFMASNYWLGNDPDAKGDAFSEYADLFTAGVDGVFSDHPDTAVAAREDWLAHSSGIRTHATRYAIASDPNPITVPSTTISRTRLASTPK